MIDIRAQVSCSLGTLISASISDDYIQGNGLIKTKGSCELKGIYRPSIGTAVTFTYVKGGVTRTIPRYLFVVSSFADPFRRTTKVELGCRLTMLQGMKDKIQWGPYDDPENAEVTSAEAKIVTSPIHASSVAAHCLQKLGISGSIALGNRFSVSKFDYSPGYVQVLGDLYVSECRCGYMSSGSGLTVFSLSVSGGTARVLTQANLIDIGPIGVGQLPADAVTVSYNTLKLKAPNKTSDLLDEAAGPETPPAEPPEDPTEDPTPSPDKRDWEKEVLYGPLTTIPVTYRKADGTNASYTFQYTPVDTVITTYDIWDRVIKRVSTRRTIGAELNASYIQTLFELKDAEGNLAFSAIPSPQGWGGARYTIRTETLIKYKIAAYKLKPGVDDKYGGSYEYKGRVEDFDDLPADPQYGDAWQVENRCFAEYVWNDEEWEPQLAKDDPANEATAYPEGYDEVESETETVVEPVLSVLGSVAPGYVDENGQLIPLDLSGYVKTSEVTTYYDKAPRSIAVLNAEQQIDGIYDIPTSKVVTTTKRVYAATASGQQDLAMRADQGQTINDFSSSALSLVYAGTSVQLRSGRESTLQARPSKAERVAQQQADDNGTNGTGSTSAQQENTASTQEENGGYQVVGKSEVELALGGSGAQIRIDLSMPYAPDDTFQRTGSCPNVTYTATPSDAPQKARSFGLAQNRMIHGNRYGMNIQITPELMPSAPYSPLVISINGVSALYRTNGTTWTISSDGIIASTDALFMGGVGGSGELFFPTAPGITSLPAAPGIVDGFMEVVQTVPVWNETLLAEATVRTGMRVERLSYALSLLSEPDAIRTRAGTAVVRVKEVTVNAAVWTVAALLPSVRTGKRISVPVAGVAISANTPAVNAGKRVDVPSLETSVNSHQPAYVGTFAAVVPLLETQFNLASHAPQVRAGVRVDVPETAFTVAGQVALVYKEPPTYFSVGAQAAGTGTIVVSWPSGHVANDIGLMVIETDGAGTTLTPPSGWAAVTGSPVVDVASSAGSKLQVWWRRATSSSEGGVAIADSGDHQTARIYVFRGCRVTGNPWTAVATGTKAVASTTATVPAVTPTDTWDRIVLIVSRPDDDSSITHFSNITNANLEQLVIHAEAGSINGNGGGFVVGSGLMRDAVSTGTTTLTKSASTTDAYMAIALTGS